MPQRKPVFHVENFFNGDDVQRSQELVKSNTGYNYRITNVPIDEIIFNKDNIIFNALDTDEDIELLARNMETPNSLRNPIILNKMPDGRLILLSGERRTRVFFLKRKQELEGNPTLKSTKWDRIPAKVLSVSEATAAAILVFENVENRSLSYEQRFRAVEWLISQYQSELEKPNGGINKQLLAKKLGVCEKTIQRITKLHKSASEEDIKLYNEGKISFDEFKKRTNERIKAQNEELTKRNEIISRMATPKSYYEETTDSVYFIERTADPRTNENRYCTFLITKLTRYALHIPGLGEYPSRSLAQVDLDRFAINNGLTEYTGDFSEYEVDATLDANLSEDNTENTNNLSDTIEHQSTNSVKDDVDSEGTINTPTEDSTENKPNENEGTDLTATEFYDVESPSDGEKTPDKSEISGEIQSVVHDSDEVSSPTDIEDVPTENKVSAPEPPSNKITGDISHFQGINVHGMSIQGSLFAAPSGKVFIISNFEFGKYIGKGKFEVKCTAEEVDPNSVIRIDDV